MEWIKEKSAVVEMVFDKPTNLFAWITGDGKAYAVRKPAVPRIFTVLSHRQQSDFENGIHGHQKIWKGWLFHDNANEHALRASINARFSLIAVACQRYIFVPSTSLR